MSFERISVIGLGYIGLPTACMFARSGASVVGVDVDARAVESINRGRAQFAEPDLDLLLARVVASGKLRATTEAEPADAFVIAVPTPFKNDRAPDLSYIETAARTIAPHLRAGNLVVLESTSPVGATEQMIQWLATARPDLRFPERGGEAADVFVAHCPERVLPGRILVELVDNDRVIGGVTSGCTDRARQLYELFVRGACLRTDARTAEMVKLTENASRDVAIAFANELSLLAERLEVDVWELIALANRHPRVDVLQPGPGVGGHCIAVDPWFLIHSAPELSPLMRTAREVNDAKPAWVVERIREASKRFDAPVIACLGLAYKANVGDCRESPAVKVVQHLAEQGHRGLLAVEPHLESLPAELAGRDVSLVDLQTALERADVVALLVEHNVFRGVNRDLLRDIEIVDVLGVWR
ncbi:MAG: UDP-N-acetyl-D-mannosamine dehydrogenase [Myxococcota bacterium]